MEKITGVDPEKIVSSRLHPTPQRRRADEVPVVASADDAFTINPADRRGGSNPHDHPRVTVNPSDPGMFSEMSRLV